MVARYLFLGGLAAGAIASAVSLLPADIERVSMLERDGRFEAAMTELDRLHASGNKDPRISIALYKLKVHFGELQSAQALIERYAAARPRDTQAQLGLIRFYQQTQQSELYVKALAGLQERTRSVELQKELIGYYRLNGRNSEEEELLERANRTGRASTADIERLGMLAATRGELVRAARALRRVDGRLEAATRTPRMSLFAILIDLKEYDDALSRSASWLRSWQDPTATLEFMDAFVAAGRSDLAIDLSRRFGAPGSEIMLTGIELLAEANRLPEARERLAEFARPALPETRDHAARFISLAIAVEDYPLAVKAARNIGLRQLPSAIVADLIEALYEDSNQSTPDPVSYDILKGFSAEIESRLIDPVSQSGKDALTLPPQLMLYAAQLAVADSNRDLALRFMSTIDPSQLSPDATADWNELKVWTGLERQPQASLTPPRPGKKLTLAGRRNRVLVRRLRPKENPAQVTATGLPPLIGAEVPPLPTATKPKRPRVRERQIDRVREARRVAVLKRSDQKAAQEQKDAASKNVILRPELKAPVQ